MHSIIDSHLETDAGTIDHICQAGLPAFEIASHNICQTQLDPAHVAFDMVAETDIMIPSVFVLVL